MKIKEVEQLLGVERANIRYYEKEALISPNRTKNSYRDYSPEDVERLKIIIILRKIGVSITDIRSVLNGEKSLADALKENEQNLLNQMKELNGALRLCQKMEKEQVELDTIDSDYYWEEIHQEENKGNVFVDICKDYLKYEKGILYSIFGDIDDFADKIGWNRSKKILALAVVLAYCTGLGLFGFFVLKEESFWESFRIPLLWFIVASLLYLPDFLLQRKYPKAAKLYKKFMPIACAVVIGLFLILILIMCILNLE